MPGTAAGSRAGTGAVGAAAGGGKRGGSAAPASGTGPEEMEARLEEATAELLVVREKADRLAAALAVLDAERGAAAGAYAAERYQTQQLAEHQARQLAEQTHRAEAAEAALATTRAALDEARASAAAAAAAAAERRAAEAAAAAAALTDQRDAVAQAKAFLAERSGLQQREQALQAELDEERRAAVKKQMELERRHAAERDAWRRETAEAVDAAREEAAALADERLDATTKQTLLENEEMAGELQYQGRHAQAVLARCAALQAEAAELRAALGVARGTEEELAQKVVAAERTVASVLARLEEVEGARTADGTTLGTLAAQLAAAQADAHSTALRAADRAAHAAELEQRVAALQGQLAAAAEARDDDVHFLMSCLSDVRRELVAADGRAALAAASSGDGAGDAAAAAWASPLEGPPGPANAPLLLSELPQRQREAALVRLLELLAPAWREREGLVLPACGPARPPPHRSPSTAVATNAGSPNETAAAAASADATSAAAACPDAIATTASANPQAAPPARTVTCRVRSQSAAAGTAAPPTAGSVCTAGPPRSVCTRSELMAMVLSDVRPWGEQASAPPTASGSSNARGSPGATAADVPVQRLQAIPSGGSEC